MNDQTLLKLAWYLTLTAILAGLGVLTWQQLS